MAVVRSILFALAFYIVSIPFVIHAFIEALKAGAPMPIDIHDAVTWSAITPLSEALIAGENKSVGFPDFTRGGWKTSRPIFAPGIAY